MSFFQNSRSSSPEPAENTFSPSTNDVPVEPPEQSVDIENVKRKLREQAILEQYSKNDQCFYYGTINNKSKANEPLVKFGNSNDLSARVNAHRKVYDGFCLVNAFRVQNKIQVENAMKEHPILSKYRRKIEIKGIHHNELLAVDKLSFDDLNKIIRNVIDSIKFSSVNYLKLLAENELFKSKYENLKTKYNSLRIHHCHYHNLVLQGFEKQRQIEKKKNYTGA
jgi:T5orf172 domain